jgi:hypothetical protein
MPRIDLKAGILKMEKGFKEWNCNFSLSHIFLLSFPSSLPSFMNAYCVPCSGLGLKEHNTSVISPPHWFTVNFRWSCNVFDLKSAKTSTSRQLRSQCWFVIVFFKAGPCAPDSLSPSRDCLYILQGQFLEDWKYKMIPETMALQVLMY